jgi:hypothetical protein
MLVLIVKSVDLGNFHKVSRGGEVCVDIECGNFHTRTSYLREAGNKVSINEKIIIDLDNDSKKTISFNVYSIEHNDLDQYEKDKIEAEILGSAEVDYDAWGKKSKSHRINIFDEEDPTEVIIHLEASTVIAKPDISK